MTFGLTSGYFTLDKYYTKWPMSEQSRAMCIGNGFSLKFPPIGTRYFIYTFKKIKMKISLKSEPNVA